MTWDTQKATCSTLTAEEYNAMIASRAAPAAATQDVAVQPDFDLPDPATFNKSEITAPNGTTYVRTVANPMTGQPAEWYQVSKNERGNYVGYQKVSDPESPVLTASDFRQVETQISRDTSSFAAQQRAAEIEQQRQQRLSDIEVQQQQAAVAQQQQAQTQELQSQLTRATSQQEIDSVLSQAQAQGLQLNAGQVQAAQGRVQQIQAQQQAQQSSSQQGIAAAPQGSNPLIWQQVNDMYVQELGRNADLGGHQNFYNELASGRLSIEGARQEMRSSPEGMARSGAPAPAPAPAQQQAAPAQQQAAPAPAPAPENQFVTTNYESGEGYWTQGAPPSDSWYSGNDG
jgi:hypothetical protein